MYAYALWTRLRVYVVAHMNMPSDLAFSKVEAKINVIPRDVNE